MVPTLAIRSLFGLLLCHFVYCYLSEHFLIFYNTRYSRIISYVSISCPSPRISHFFKEPWFLSVKNALRDHEPGVECAHDCRSIIDSRLSQQMGLGNTRVYTYLCTHTHTHTHIHPYLYWGKHKFIVIYPNFIPYHMVHVNLL